MSFFDRFLGRRGDDDSLAAPVANPSLETPPSFTLLFPAPLDLDAAGLELMLRNYHPELELATVEFTPLTSERAPEDGEPEPNLIGLAAWKDHVVKLVGFDHPVPEELFSHCVDPSHIVEELKADARQHQAHVMLVYAGYVDDPTERMVALAVVATALTHFGAVLLLNEPARTAFPAEAMLADDDGADPLRGWRELPIPLFYAGLVKYEVEGDERIWIRTHGCPELGLPDLAVLADGHHKGNDTFDLFASVLNYLRSTGSEFEPGAVLDMGEAGRFTLRESRPTEYWLRSTGPLFVLEPGDAAE